MSRTASLVFAIVAGFSISALPAGVRGDDHVEMSLPFFKEPTHEIVSIDQEAKTAIVTAKPQGMMFFTGEGFGVLLLPSSGRGSFDTMVRVKVRTVLNDGKLVVLFGDDAAAAMREGPAVLMRPFAGEFGGTQRPLPATTKQLRDLPDVITTKSPQAGSGLLGAIEAARAAARRAQSMNNLKQIALAFHNYSDVYNAFPPAVIYGPDGKPWHSWRVLLLPFLEQAALYEQYDFSEPWDSPKNIKLAETVLAVYRDPAREGNDAFTDYGAIVGENAIFRPDFVKMKSADDFPACLTGNKTHFRDVTDGTSNTIMFATLDPSRKIPWTKPEDIVFDETFPGVGKPAGIGAIHTGAGPNKPVALVGLTDGSVRVIPGDLDTATITPFLTRNGGEVVRNEALGENPRAAGGRAQQPLVRIFKTDDGSYAFSID